MAARLLLIAFVFNAAACATVLAQFQVPESQLAYVEQELKVAQETLAKKAAAINYQDPGEDRGWSVSQAAWEKMESKIGSPPPTIEKMIAKDPAQRDDIEKTSLRDFYLGFVNEKAKPELQSLAERAELLQFHKSGGENGITDSVQLAISKRFWKRRLVDAYRTNNQDKPKTRKLVIKFLSRAADNFADDGRLDNSTDSIGRDCLKAGCKNPVFRAVSFHVNSHEFKRRNAKARKDLSKIIDQLESPKYSPILSMLARTAQCDVFRGKNFDNGKELDPEKADELENAYNDSILDMLTEESKCPENIESLKHLFYWMIASNFRGNRHCIALYEQILKSELDDGFKQTALQKLSRRLSRSRKLELKVREDYLKSAVKHGEEATKQLPLSDSVVEQLGNDTLSRTDPEICKKWFELGKQRAPGRYTMYRSYFSAVAGLSDDEEQAEFMLELLNSDQFETGIPWIGIRLIREGVGSNYYTTDKKDIRDNREVALALEKLLKKAPEQGMTPEWCKKQKQFLCHVMLQAGYFDDALRVAKDLEGDFGSYQYKNQKLTLARIAELSNPMVRDIQESIDAGTFDIAKIGETIEKLTEARMDMGSNEGIYIDELLDLLGSVEVFESGEWANLTPKTVHLSNWQGYHSSDWRPTQNGISPKSNNSSTLSELGWRWKVNSEYMLEADIEIAPMKKFSKKRGAFAGFGISNGRFINVPAVEVLLNPHKSIAQMDAFRRKEFGIKPMLNQKGVNRVRMRVWKDYFEFTINGNLAGQFAMCSAIPGHVVLRKGYGAAEVTYKNVRVKKLTSPSPTGERRDDPFYWSKRLRREKDSKDVQLALENAKSKQKDGDQQDPKGEASPTRTPIKVDEGLVAMWTFDQNLSETVSKGEARSALPTKLVDGKLGSGLQLSQSNDSNVIIADGEGPADLDGPFTVSFWARWESEQGVLISQASESAYLMVQLHDGDLQISHRRPVLTLDCNLRGNLPLKTWQHITITYDGSPNAEGIEVFLDGKKRNDSKKRGFHPEDARALPPIDSSKTQMHFGCNPFFDRPKFGSNATIDELRVYNRKLSADEIKQVKSYGLK